MAVRMYLVAEPDTVAPDGAGTERPCGLREVRGEGLLSTVAGPVPTSPGQTCPSEKKSRFLVPGGALDQDALPYDFDFRAALASAADGVDRSGTGAVFKAAQISGPRHRVGLAPVVFPLDVAAQSLDEGSQPLAGPRLDADRDLQGVLLGAALSTQLRGEKGSYSVTCAFHFSGAYLPAPTCSSIQSLALSMARSL